MFPADRHAPYGAVQVSGIRGSGQAGPPGDSEPGRHRREILIGVLPAVKTHLKNIDTRFRRLVNSIFTEECTGEEIDKIAEVSALIVEKLKKYDLK